MRRKIGCHFIKDGECQFIVWAPFAASVNVSIKSEPTRIIALQKEELGYWSGTSKEVAPGDLYVYHTGKGEWPDPASLSQPEDVHGPSQIIDHRNFNWQDAGWKGILLQDMIIYELHIGTFTTEGTFKAVITKLDHLAELGINAIEIMPVGQFPGNRNWGYDGVYPFAVQHSYGGSAGLKELINACHQAGIAVIIDAVYNHFGPEGNYNDKFGPYHTDKYHTPWGNALNFDDAYCDEVRNYFIQNALMWFRDYHIDALRLDAVHACKDMSSNHFLKELSAEIKQLSKETGRFHFLIAECDLNDPKYISSAENGGYGLDGQWCDEFHHSLRSVITEDTDGYYEDFGTLRHLKKAFKDSFVYTGEYSVHRKKTFGARPDQNPYSQFIVFCQNHDQVGNRLLGDRISTLVSFEALKTMAGSVLVSPSVPMLFMGEEFGENTPFQYFVSHSDKTLIENIREGRKKEFAYFNFQGESPDPQAEETFSKSKINWNFQEDERKTLLLSFYKALIQLRKSHPAFKNQERNALEVRMEEDKGVLELERYSETDGKSSIYIAISYNKADTSFAVQAKGQWKLYMDSADMKWGGPGKAAADTAAEGETISISGQSVVIYIKS